MKSCGWVMLDATTDKEWSFLVWTQREVYSRSKLHGSKSEHPSVNAASDLDVCFCFQEVYSPLSYLDLMLNLGYKIRDFLGMKIFCTSVSASFWVPKIIILWYPRLSNNPVAKTVTFQHIWVAKSQNRASNTNCSTTYFYSSPGEKVFYAQAIWRKKSNPTACVSLARRPYYLNYDSED